MAKGAAARRGAGDALLEKIRVPLMQRGSLTCEGRTEDLFVIDLALSGIFVERQEPLQAGTHVEVSFRLPGNEIPVAATCRVAWWHPEGAPLASKALPSGMGLAFVTISESDRAKIREQLRDHFKREPRERRFAPRWLLWDDEKGPA